MPENNQLTKEKLIRNAPKNSIRVRHYKQLTDRFPTDTENVSLLQRCASYWDTLYNFRFRRKRARMYLRGEQWNEAVYNPIQKAYTTEAQYIRDQGRIPFKQNIVRPTIKTAIGQYRSNPTKSTVIARDREDAALSEMLTNRLQSCLDVNRTKELDARNLEEFFISGAAVSKSRFTYLKKYRRYDGFVENRNPARMFWNTDVSDIRGIDINIIGEIHDMSIDDVQLSFAKTPQEKEWLRGIYSQAKNKSIVVSTYGMSSKTIDYLTFLYPDDASNKCRVIEVWEKRCRFALEEHDYANATWEKTLRTPSEVDAINQSRINQAIAYGITDPGMVKLIEYTQCMDEYWYYKFLSPYGHTLSEGESPYEHGEHPYTLLLFPMIDGECWGLIEDIIDQQRYINRIIGLMDAIIGSSSKGVLLVPEDVIPGDMNLNDFSSEWSKFNGVIKIKLKPGAQLPVQIASKASNLGLSELLQIQMQLNEQISGVRGAQQGQAPTSGTPSSLYNQQIVQSNLNNLDMIESYNAFIRERDGKLLKVICQFDNTKKYIGSIGKTYSEEAKTWNPDLVKNVDSEVRVISGMDTPAYRMMMDDMLMQLLQAQQIDLKMFLENSSIPFADKMLEALNNKQEEIQNNPGGETAQQEVSPEMLAQQANPDAVKLAQQYAGRNN